MKNKVKITAIVGTYRKGGVIDQLVDEVLQSARQEGASVRKIYLINRYVEFCTNCRNCAQEPGPNRGACVHDDQMGAILDEIDGSDAVVLASPMNFGTVTAIFKRFVERLVCYSYWPWGQNAPKMRKPGKDKVSLLIASSAAPAPLARMSSKMVGLMKDASETMGAKPVDVLFVGLAAGKKQPRLDWLSQKRAQRMGKKLAAKCQGGKK